MEEEKKSEFKFPISAFEKPKQEKPQSKTGEMIQDVFNAAVVQTVAHDEGIKEEIVDSAKNAIHNKTKAIKDQMEAEAKEAHFINNKSACECFGFTETSTEKWAVSMMKVWHRIMTAIWIIIGFVTYAPVSFIAQKIGVIIKRTWLAVLVAGIIYILIALSPLWFSLIKKIGGV